MVRLIAPKISEIEITRHKIGNDYDQSQQKMSKMKREDLIIYQRN